MVPRNSLFLTSLVGILLVGLAGCGFPFRSSEPTTSAPTPAGSLFSSGSDVFRSAPDALPDRDLWAARRWLERHARELGVQSVEYNYVQGPQGPIPGSGVVLGLRYEEDGVYGLIVREGDELDVETLRWARIGGYDAPTGHYIYEICWPGPLLFEGQGLPPRWVERFPSGEYWEDKLVCEQREIRLETARFLFPEGRIEEAYHSLPKLLTVKEYVKPKVDEEGDDESEGPLTASQLAPGPIFPEPELPAIIVHSAESGCVGGFVVTWVSRWICTVGHPLGGCLIGVFNSQHALFPIRCEGGGPQLLG